MADCHPDHTACVLSCVLTVYGYPTISPARIAEGIQRWVPYCYGLHYVFCSALPRTGQRWQECETLVLEREDTSSSL